MSEWDLIVSSRRRVDGWLAGAHRLFALLNAVSTAVAAEYGTPLNWRSESWADEQWAEPETITAIIEDSQLRDDAGKVMNSGGAGGTVQGYQPGASGLDFMVNVRWNVGGDWESQVGAVLGFHEARPLREHSTEWLVSLVNAASEASQADEARICTTKTIRALRRQRADHAVSELTLLPWPVDPTALPSTMTAYPGPSHLPGSTVVAVDLQRSARDPQSLVADLLRLDDLLKARR